jgi:hypothetical protein
MSSKPIKIPYSELYKGLLVMGHVPEEHPMKYQYENPNSPPIIDAIAIFRKPKACCFTFMVQSSSMAAATCGTFVG